MKTKLKLPRLDRLVALALGALLLGAFLLSQKVRTPETHTAPTSAPVRVALATAERAEVPVLAVAVGTVRSRRQTEIAARVLAEVKEVRRQPGDEVAPGETLIVLDSRDLAAKVEGAEANLASVQESREEAKVEFERTRNLFAKEAATRQELDIARFRLSGLDAQAVAARKALEEARIQLGHATIAAPFGGLVFEKRADPGDLASPGKPLLGLYDPRELRLEASIEERLLSTLKVRDRIEVSFDALGKVVEGQVSEVVPAVDPSTRTGTVKVDLPGIPGLCPGMFGRARVPIARRAAVQVPRGALVRRGQLEFVFTAIEDEKRVRLTLVRSGLVIPAPSEGTAKVEVLSGLDPGARVVASGAGDLRDGDPIEAGAPGKEGGR